MKLRDCLGTGSSEPAESHHLTYVFTYIHPSVRLQDNLKTNEPILIKLVIMTNNDAGKIPLTFGHNPDRDEIRKKYFLFQEHGLLGMWPLDDASKLLGNLLQLFAGSALSAILVIYFNMLFRTAF